MCRVTVIKIIFNFIWIFWSNDPHMFRFLRIQISGIDVSTTRTKSNKIFIFLQTIQWNRAFFSVLFWEKKKYYHFCRWVNTCPNRLIRLSRNVDREWYMSKVFDNVGSFVVRIWQHCTWNRYRMECTSSQHSMKRWNKNLE